MAKSKSKETSVPLIFALVFFILTTIAFGAMWYMSYSDMEAKNAEVKKAKEDLVTPREVSRENEMTARVYRLWMGLEIDGVTDDKSSGEAEKGSATVSNELAKLNDALMKKLGVTDPDKLDPE